MHVAFWQDVIHTISTPCGLVQRVAIFRKNGVQALVEFDSTVSAQRAKQHLDGADIYAGCCTLKIEYARVRLPLLSLYYLFILIFICTLVPES